MSNINALLETQIASLDNAIASIQSQADTALLNAMLNLDSLAGMIDTITGTISYTPVSFTTPTISQPQTVQNISPDDNILPTINPSTFTTVTNLLNSLEQEISSITVSTDVSDLITSIQNLQDELSEFGLDISFDTTGLDSITITQPDNVNTGNLLSELTIQEPDIPDTPTFNIDNKLLQILNHIYSTLLNPTSGLGGVVEQGIFNRATEREKELLRFAEEKELSTWASRGFNLPSSIVHNQLKQVREKFYDEKLTTSRDIMAKQAELALDYRKTLLQLIDNIVNREYQFVISKAEMSFKIAELANNIRVAYYNIILTMRKNIAEVLGILMQRYAQYLEYIKVLFSKETTKVDVMKTEVEAKVNTFNGLVNLFSAKANSLKSLVDTLQSQVSLAGIKADFLTKKTESIAKLQEIINVISVEKFRGDIALKSENLKKNTAYYNAYTSYLDTMNRIVNNIYQYNAQLNETLSRVEIAKLEAKSKGAVTYADGFCRAIGEQIKMLTSLSGVAVQAKHIGIQIDGGVRYSGDVDQMVT